MYVGETLPAITRDRVFICFVSPRYITIMTSPDDECLAPYVNYYSNPDVMHLGRPTGTATEDCARGIRDTMVSRWYRPPPPCA